MELDRNAARALRIEKEEVKLYLFDNKMISYLESLKKSIEVLLSKISKVK